VAAFSKATADDLSKVRKDQSLNNAKQFKASVTPEVIMKVKSEDLESFKKWCLQSQNSATAIEETNDKQKQMALAYTSTAKENRSTLELTEGKKESDEDVQKERKKIKKGSKQDNLKKSDKTEITWLYFKLKAK